MNVNDTEIAWSILKDEGYSKTDDVLQVRNVNELYILAKVSSKLLLNTHCHLVDRLATNNNHAYWISIHLLHPTKC